QQGITAYEDQGFGIAEWIEDGVNGFLVAPPSESGAWADMIGRLSEAPDSMERIADSISLTRTMEDVAVEMQNLYSQILHHRKNG
ncbi:MAG: hypothetical protein KDE09_17050, partial [Anaerolineales bacterium]|nr:hypothetical protein [Anaerolineales bacterium]